MAKGLLSLAWTGLVGLAWATAPAQAQPPPPSSSSSHPCKVDFGVNFRFNIYTVPNVVPRAPWYTYFPYDPHLMAPPPGSHYPGWPNPFPPKDAPAGAATPNNMPPLVPRSASIAAAATAQTLQPVGYFSYQTPSYWYGR